MSRRVANPAADRAAQNLQTIKSLLKLEGNKSCADCKRNKRVLPEPVPQRKYWKLDERKLTVAFTNRSTMGELESRGLCLHKVPLSIFVELEVMTHWFLDVLAFIVAWGRTSVGLSLSTLIPGRTSSFKACCGGEMQGQTSQWLVGMEVLTCRLILIDTGKLSWHRGMSLQKREHYTGLHTKQNILIMARKIENFIRTKYESKRWVMEGPMPDPSTLDVDGDDDVVCLSSSYSW